MFHPPGLLSREETDSPDSQAGKLRRPGAPPELPNGNAQQDSASNSTNQGPPSCHRRPWRQRAPAGGSVWLCTSPSPARGGASCSAIPRPWDGSLPCPWVGAEEVTPASLHHHSCHSLNTALSDQRPWGPGRGPRDPGLCSDRQKEEALRGVSNCRLSPHAAASPQEAAAAVTVGQTARESTRRQKWALRNLPQSEAFQGRQVARVLVRTRVRGSDPKTPTRKRR